jgi:hypothetical protein
MHPTSMAREYWSLPAGGMNCENGGTNDKKIFNLTTDEIGYNVQHNSLQNIEH